MKDEFKEEIISQFVRLQSNMYSLIAVDGKKVKKETGVNKNVVKSIRHKKFANVLFMTKIVKHNMKRIQSKLHRIRAYDVCKTSLS